MEETLVLTCSQCFSSDEKLWVAKGLNGKLEEDPAWINLGIDFKNRYVKSEFANLFQIHYKTVYRWFDNYNSGKFLGDSNGGRPNYNSKDDLHNIYQFIITNNAPNKRPTDEKLGQLFHNAAIESAKQRGHSQIKLLHVTRPSDKTVKRYIKQLDLTSRSPQIENATIVEKTEEKKRKDIEKKRKKDEEKREIDALSPAQKKVNTNHALGAEIDSDSESENE